jgi:murein DD-endopeptidase MepM/ murein hydrolase activator NlpD
MHRNARFRQVAVLTAIVSALGAVTAFGVAPLAEVDLPPIETVTESVVLGLQNPDAIESVVQTETIRRGDTLAALLARLGANDPEFLRFAASDPLARKAMQLRAGRSVQAEVDWLGRVTRYSYRVGGLEDDSRADDVRPAKRLEIRRDGEKLVASEAEIPLERSTEMRSVEIRSSLFAATDAAGIPESVAIKVAEIFGGDIDFHRDLRKGDRLRVVYETVREADSLDAAAASKVLAVEFVNDGQRYDALLFERDDRPEYFAFDGRSLKKAFLRNPIEFSRVSSGFSNARLHPIMRDWRAHRGVDFAAPTGTRVRASADGIVEFIGQQRGYGNVLIIDHRGDYSSLYAHLNGFAEGLRRGARVRQGDTIGTVGSTGWATGPHLHYEIMIRGEQVDPMKVALPESAPLDGEDRIRLQLAATEMRLALDQLDVIRLARFE